MLELVWSWCSMYKKKQKTEAEQECQAGRKSGITWRNSEWTRDYRRVLIGWVNFLHRLEGNTKPKGQVLHQTVWGVCSNFLKLLTMLIKEIVFHKMNSWKSHKMADLLKLHKEFPIAACPVNIVQTFNILSVLQWIALLSIC